MRQSITVNRPVEEAYAFWHNFENFPLVMDYLDAVHVVDGRSHWKAKAPTETEMEWEATMTEDRPNETITWQSVEGASLRNRGSVQFVPAPAGRGTEVYLDLVIDPPGGKLGDLAAKLMGADPGLLAMRALHRFKSLLETGEIPTTRNQPAARNDGRDEE